MKLYKSKKRRCFLLFLMLIPIYIFVGLLKPLTVSKYEYKSRSVPKSFDGFKIVQLSDFHCQYFGKNEKNLVNKIKALSPDLIVFTGDMLDESHSTDNLESLLSEIQSVAPIYAITGNHDNTDKPVYAQLQKIYDTYNVKLLNNTVATLTYNNDSINLYGSTFLDWSGNCIRATDPDKLNILLYHDANSFDTISQYGHDIILSGHIHGGIIRIPFVGGLIGNSKNLFPKYTEGAFYDSKNNCTMYVSRGLGDSIIPRFYNPPELVLLTLYCQ